jgi:DNA (cytosine-5)-methyltransferase 1
MDCKDEINKWCKFHDYDFWKYNGEQRRDKIARNLVDFEAGRTILETALNVQRENKIKQQTLF